MRTQPRASVVAARSFVVSGRQRTTTNHRPPRPALFAPGFTGRLAPRASRLRLVATSGISGSEAADEISSTSSSSSSSPSSSDGHPQAAGQKEQRRREEDAARDPLVEAERALEELGEEHAAAAELAAEAAAEDAVEDAAPSATADEVILTTDDDGNVRFKQLDKRIVVRNLLRRMRGKEDMSARETAEWIERNEAKIAAKKVAKKVAKQRKAASKKPGFVARIKATVGGGGERKGNRRKKGALKRDAFDRELRGEFDKAKLESFFKRRPGQVAARLAAVLRVAARLIRLWRREDSLPPEKRTRSEQLRAALSGLGPVFVKIGQTLSQRPDLIGEEAADALKSLQMQNAPFPDEVAWRTIAEDLQFDGPLAPNHPSQSTCEDPDARPLFKDFTDGPIAAASLGQVYKATTWDGVEMAVKVQRPRVMRQVALDWTVWSLCLSALKRAWGSKANLAEIADEVGVGVFKELDYVNEARNMDEFNAKHKWLGFVRAPEWYPEFTGAPGTAKVLATEWIDGKQISELPPEQRLVMAQMAVEACVAQLTYTGFVHADPHEGNLLLDQKDGSLVFLDFGLVSTVEDNIMEGFAKGIQCMIAGDWVGLAYVFRDVGMCPPDNFYRKEIVPGEKRKKLVAVSAEEMAAAIDEALSGEEGGQSRFGALATGLGAMSGTYKFLTPPYIVLLVRTFLTLEGIAAKADPDFNIYTASLPYAIRRAMAPATPEGRKAMRAAFLNEHDNSVRWDRITELVGGAKASGSGDETFDVASKTDEDMENEIFADLVAGASSTTDSPSDVSLDEAEKAMIAPMAQAADAMLAEVMDTAAAAAASDKKEREGIVKDAVGSPAVTAAGVDGREDKGRGPGREADGRMTISRKRSDGERAPRTPEETFGGDPNELIARRSQAVVSRLIGARDGAALRRVASDANSVSLATYMTSPEAKPLWAAGSAQLTRVAKDFFGVRKEERERARASKGKEGKDAWPESQEAREIRAREEKTQRKAIAVIALGHLKRLWSGGPRGWALLFQLALITARMSALALVQTAFAGMGEIAETFLKFLWSVATAPVRFVTKIGAGAGDDAEAGVEKR